VIYFDRFKRGYLAMLFECLCDVIAMTLDYNLVICQVLFSLSWSDREIVEVVWLMKEN